MVEHALDQVHQGFLVEGFLDEVQAPFFMVFTAMGTSPWPVMKTMGRGRIALEQAVLQVQARHAAHADINNQTGDFARVVARQKRLGRVETAHPVISAFEQPLERIADGFIVVHHIDGAFWESNSCNCPWVCAFATGSVVSLAGAASGNQKENRQPVTSDPL